MTNSADPDQLAYSEANWSVSTLFAKAGHIRVQQDKGWTDLKKKKKGDYTVPWIIYCTDEMGARYFEKYEK